MQAIVHGEPLFDPNLELRRADGAVISGFIILQAGEHAKVCKDHGLLLSLFETDKIVAEILEKNVSEVAIKAQCPMCEADANAQ